MQGANLPLKSMTPAQNLLPVLTTPVANLPWVSTIPVVNFGTAGAVDASKKFTTGVNNTGGKLPLESTTPAAIFATGVHATTPVANNRNNIRVITL
jgi:hypothetical protein